MSNDAIGGRYRLYKAETARVVRWLTDTAVSCRHSIGKRSSSDTVSSKELKQFTELIVSWRPPIAIPAEIIELTESVIQGRSMCAEFYTKQGLYDAGHQAFIETLQYVLEMLKEARSKTSIDKKATRHRGKTPQTIETPPREAAGTVAISNLFASLQVESTSRTSGKKKSVQETATLGVPPVVLAEATLTDDASSDDSFALWCVAQDLAEIRAIIQEAWEAYRDGESSAVVASEVTSIGSEYLRTAVENISHLDSIHYGQLGVPVLGAESQTSDAEVGIDELLASRPGLHAFDSLFSDLRQAVKQSKKPWSQVIRSSITQGVDRASPLAFVAAILLCLDIERIMNGRGYEVLSMACSSSNRTDVVYQRYFTFRQTYTGGATQPLDLLEVWEQERKKQALAWSKKPCEALPMGATYWGPAWTWSDLPLIAGQALGMQQINSHFTAIFIGNDAKVMLAIAHLYRAGQHAKFLKPDAWEDMEWFLEEHSRERPFVQAVGPNGDVGRYYQHLWLALGMSPAAFASTAHRSPNSARTATRLSRPPREFHSSSILTRTIREQKAADYNLGMPDRRSEGDIVLATLAKTKTLEHRGATFAQFLQTFKEMKSRDEVGLWFDYTSFWIACAELLSSLRPLPQHPSAGTYTESFSDHATVSDILCEAAYTTDSDILATACQILQDFIAGQGSKFTKEAFTAARGQIPELWASDTEDGGSAESSVEGTG